MITCVTSQRPYLFTQVKIYCSFLWKETSLREMNSKFRAQNVSSKHMWIWEILCQWLQSLKISICVIKNVPWKRKGPQRFWMTSFKLSRQSLLLTMHRKKQRKICLPELWIADETVFLTAILEQCHFEPRLFLIDVESMGKPTWVRNKDWPYFIITKIWFYQTSW